MQQAAHTTSDLLRLLAAEGAPFADVAAAVAARFGGDPASRAWLARTLVTLLRDGLLYTEAEKLNAAYLLRFAAPDAPGAREALLHLSLPDSGEPAAVRAWAASLATAPAWQLAQLQAAVPASPGRAAGLEPAPTSQEAAAAALLHSRSPQQVLADAAAPLDGHVQFCGLQLGPPPPLLPWQREVGALQPGTGVGSPQQQQQQQQRRQSLEVEASLAALASTGGSGGSLQPSLQPASPTAAWPPQQPPVAPPQLQQPPPAQQQAALQQQQLAGLQSLLSQAASSPLVPAMQQRLIEALRGSLAAALTEAMAEAVDGGAASSSGGARDALQPQHMRGLVEHNSSVAAELLLALTARHPAAAAVYAAAVAEAPMSAQSVECISTVIGRGELPDWVLTTFLSNCMQDTNACQDAGRQSRQVKLLCACVGLALQHQPASLAEALPELQSFCIQQSRYKPAADLYRQLRDLGQ